MIHFELDRKSKQARKHEGHARIGDSRGVPGILESNRFKSSTGGDERRSVGRTPGKWEQLLAVDNHYPRASNSSIRTTLPLAKKTVQEREDHLPSFGSFSSTINRRKRQNEKQIKIDNERKRAEQKRAREQQQLAENNSFQKSNQDRLLARLLNASQYSSYDDDLFGDEDISEESFYCDNYSTDELYFIFDPSCVCSADVESFAYEDVDVIEPVVHSNATLTIQDQYLYYANELTVNINQHCANQEIVVNNKHLTELCLLQMALLYCLIYCSFTYVQRYDCSRIPVLHGIRNLGRRYVCDLRTN